MSNPSAEEIAESLLRVGLTSDSEVTRVTDAAITEGKRWDGPSLIQEMLENGRITPWQADQCRLGRASMLLLGNYLLLNQIGEGGMGTVYKAMHTKMRRVVALKTLKPDTASDEFVERFYREVQAAALLNHPNAIADYDADECEVGHFLVMEYVDGADLKSIVRKQGPLPIQEAVSAIRQAADALEYAHSQGIIHRDIKPANLMRDAQQVVKVADLGLARLHREDEEGVAEAASLTQAGTSMGTIDYMAPEQAVDATVVDHRADIYSLGCTLFYLVAGRVIYEEPTLMARLVAHRDADIPSLELFRDDVPERLNSVFQKMVQKDPADRLQSMAEVRDELAKLAQSSLISDAFEASEQTVFIVEPSKFQSAVFSDYLSKIGIDDVHVFRTASDTLSTLNALRPTLVVTSFQLPDSSGIEFAQRLRDDLRWGTLPIVLLTGSELTEEVIEFVESTQAMQLIDKPFSQEKLETAVRQAAEEGNQLQKFSGLERLKVLVVDDSSVARRRMQKVLEEIGFTRFVHADDGVPAVNQLEEQSFDLVVTDYNMPEMNGYDLVAHIRNDSEQTQVPVIMCTTEYDPMKLAEVYKLGVSAICNKSFDIELVRNIVIRLFK